VSFSAAQLCHVSEQDGWGKIPLDISLLEWFNLAREHMVEGQCNSMLSLDGFGNHVEGEKRGFGTAVVS